MKCFGVTKGAVGRQGAQSLEVQALIEQLHC